jgi:amino acid transporter
MSKGKKSQVSIYLYWFFAAIILVVIASLIAPMGVNISSQFYLQGEKLMEDSLPVINSIHNAEVRTTLNATVHDALSNTADNIEFNANLFQWGWVAVLGLSALMAFLYTRRLVEYGGGFV